MLDSPESLTVSRYLLICLLVLQGIFWSAITILAFISGQVQGKSRQFQSSNSANQGDLWVYLNWNYSENVKSQKNLTKTYIILLVALCLEQYKKADKCYEHLPTLKT